MRSFLRGAVELHILHHAAEHEIHGAWIADELARHGYRISPGTLYPTLYRMRDSGLLSSNDAIIDGRRIRRYPITDAGRAALAQARRAVRELANEVLDAAPSSAGEATTEHRRGGGREAVKPDMTSDRVLHPTLRELSVMCNRRRVVKLDTWVLTRIWCATPGRAGAADQVAACR